MINGAALRCSFPRRAALCMHAPTRPPFCLCSEKARSIKSGKFECSEPIVNVLHSVDNLASDVNKASTVKAKVKVKTTKPRPMPAVQPKESVKPNDIQELIKR